RSRRAQRDLPDAPDDRPSAGDVTCDGEPCAVKTDRAIERFLEAAGISAGTRRGYATDLREVALWFGPSRSLDAMDGRVLADWVAELGRVRPGGKLAPATIGRKLAAVRSLIRFTLGPEHVPTAVLSPRRPRRLPDAPKQREVEELVESVGVDGP